MKQRDDRFDVDGDQVIDQAPITLQRSIIVLAGARLDAAPGDREPKRICAGLQRQVRIALVLLP